MGASDGDGSSNRKARATVENSPRSKKVRSALKNARGLVSELFAREKFSVWNLAGNRARRKSPQTEPKEEGFSGRPEGQGEPSEETMAERFQRFTVQDDSPTEPTVPSTVDGATSGDSSSGETEDDAYSNRMPVAYGQGIGGRGKNPLDTLSTIGEDDDWDRMEGQGVVLGTFDDTAAMVRNGLYIGAFLAEQNKDELDRKGITHILQVGDNLTKSFEGQFHYKTILVSDTETANLLVHFRECFDFIDDANDSGGGVLVHCFAGISRSATVCIAYLMWKLSLTMGAAHSMVETARACTQPNNGFKAQLQTFESLGSDLDRLEQWNLAQHHCHAPTMSSDEFDIEFDSR